MIPSIDAIELAARMILPRTGEVFKAQLVLDREYYDSVVVQLRRNVSQERPIRILILINAGILKNTDYRNSVELLDHAKMFNAVTDNRDIRQIFRAHTRNFRAPWTTLYRNDFTTVFTQKAGNRATTGSGFEHTAAQKGRKRPKQVGTLSGEVVTRRPIADRMPQLLAEKRAIQEAKAQLEAEEK